jgi:hypothetical protein
MVRPEEPRLATHGDREYFPFDRRLLTRAPLYIRPTLVHSGPLLSLIPRVRILYAAIDLAIDPSIDPNIHSGA